MKKKIAFIIGVMAFCWSGVASAGSFAFKDPVGILSPADKDALKAAAGSWPFDLRVMTFSSKSGLESSAEAAVNSPNCVVIALGIVKDGNKISGRVAVRYGSGVNIPSSEAQAVADAGNPNFKQKGWAEGIRDIGQKAANAVTAARARPAAVPPPPPSPPTQTQTYVPPTVTIHEGIGVGGWILIVLAAAALVGFVVYVLRRQKKHENIIADFAGDVASVRASTDEASVASSWDSRLEASRRRSSPASSTSAARMSGIKRAVPRPTVPAYVPPPPPAPVYVQAPVVVRDPVIVHDRGSDLVTGMLIGEAISNHRDSSRTEIHNHYERRDETSRGASSDFSSVSDEPSRGASSDFDPEPESKRGASSDFSSDASDSGWSSPSSDTPDPGWSDNSTSDTTSVSDSGGSSEF